MKIEDYIFTQSALNKALHDNPDSKVGFALFAAMFSEQVNALREHIEEDGQLPSADFLSGIHKDTRAQYHLKAENADYHTATALNQALNSCQMHAFNLILCAQSHPLSMHNNLWRIDQDIITNCSFATQQGFKQRIPTDLFSIDDNVNPQQADMLHDIIEQGSTIL